MSEIIVGTVLKKYGCVNNIQMVEYTVFLLQNA